MKKTSIFLSAIALTFNAYAINKGDPIPEGAIQLMEDNNFHYELAHVTDDSFSSQMITHTDKTGVCYLQGHFSGTDLSEYKDRLSIQENKLRSLYGDPSYYMADTDLSSAHYQWDLSKENGGIEFISLIKTDSYNREQDSYYFSVETHYKNHDECTEIIKKAIGGSEV